MEHYDNHGEVDLRPAAVVVPGGRAGRRLIELLLERTSSRGAVFTPPHRLVTLGRLPELLYRPSRPPADAAVARQAWVRALREIPQDILASVFPARPEAPEGWLALAATVISLHRELMGEGMMFADVARSFGAAGTYNDAQRWHALGQVQDRYLELLAEVGLADLDRSRMEALASGALRTPGDVWLVGVVELPGLVRRMLQAVPGTHRSLIHAREEDAAGFDEFGCVDPAAWIDRHLPLRDDQIHYAGGPAHQAAVVTGILGGLADDHTAEEVVVGVPDRELVPYLERSLSTAGVPHRRPAGIPLSATGPFRFLQALADYLDVRTFPSLAALLRHPDLPFRAASGEEENGGRLLELADRCHAAHLPADLRATPLPGGGSRHSVQDLIDGLNECLDLETLQGRRHLSAWMPGLMDLLVGVYEGKTANQDHPRRQRILDACRIIRGAAATLAALPPVLDSDIKAPQAIRRLLAELRGDEIAPAPEEEAVQFLGWLELPLDDAPVVILTGCNEPFLPSAAGGDPILPGSLRSSLGLADDRHRSARDAYLLAALLSSRRQVHLTVGRHGAGGDPLRPSRLLFASPDEEAARRIQSCLEREEPARAAGRVPAPETRRSGFRSPPEAEIRVADPPRALRVTDFGALLTDPYRFALQRLLRLEPLDDAAREMDGRLYGTVAHEVLHRFGTSPVVHSGEVAKMSRVLDRLLDHEILTRFGTHPVPAVLVQREHLRRRLGAFANWHAGWIGEGWQVMRSEAAPEEQVFLDVDGSPLQLLGRIDRIDYHAASGVWAVFDYKTGEQGNDPEKVHRRGRKGAKRWVDLQLPLYRRLLAGFRDESGTPLVSADGLDRVRMGYILLPRDLDRTGGRLASWEPEDLAEADEAARQVVRQLRTGVFPFADGGVSFGRSDPFAALLGHLELPLLAGEQEEGGR
ncbi:MAG: PD-(D/E)XK nuclease family protein [Acidobacteria bacterium]|nr:PD-(D/E)XK nuclease family protein [Acidobacteriota bacterium]